MLVSSLGGASCIVAVCLAATADSDADRRFEQLAARFLDESTALSPVYATWLGDHRYDGQLNEVSPAARERTVALYRAFLDELGAMDPRQLSRPNQVDYALLKHELRSELWRFEVLQEWAWNPLVYTRLAGSAIYNLMARDFAPLPERLAHVADRLQQFPRLFRQIRATLMPKRVPTVHAETAVKQNRGVLSILDNMVTPHLDRLSTDERSRLERAIDGARQAVSTHQEWLEKELLPNAAGEFRLGAQRYDEKLAFTLHTPLTRAEIRIRAEAELARVREQMFTIAKNVYRETYPYTVFPPSPSDAYEQAIIRAALEMAYQQAPAADAVVSTARESLELATAFVREKDLVTVPPDPVEIIIMPEFQRGVSLAYCSAPGPLDVGQKTFYAVAPLPTEWTREQVRSFLREYNLRSIHNLTIHEAVPGHFLQLAHANRYPGKLRAVLSSGVFVEGWAVYTEQMMREEGFLDGDPLMQLIVLKWYLRGIANAIIDQRIHAGSMTRDEALRLMIEDTFQEEREAAGKWIRAQLTSAQLSTYFVGYLEHVDLRRRAEREWGDSFTLKSYHDRVLSYGSPPPRFARALLFDDPIDLD